MEEFGENDWKPFKCNQRVNMNHRHLLNNLSVFCFVLFSLENVDSNYIIILLSNTSKGQVNISVHILSRRLYRKSYPEIQTSEHIIVRPRLYSSLPMLPPLGDRLQNCCARTLHYFGSSSGGSAIVWFPSSSSPCVSGPFLVLGVPVWLHGPIAHCHCSGINIKYYGQWNIRYSIFHYTI